MSYRERATTAPIDDPPPCALLVTAALRARIVAHVAADMPCESVGLLGVARGPRPDIVRAMRLYAGTNVDASPTRYTMDPAEVISALRDIETNGWWLGAIVHSHPASPAVPSATDLREAYYPDALMVIVSLARGTPEIRSWRLISDPRASASFVEVPFLADPEQAPQPTTESLKDERP